MCHGTQWMMITVYFTGLAKDWRPKYKETKDSYHSSPLAMLVFEVSSGHVMICCDETLLHQPLVATQLLLSVCHVVCLNTVHCLWQSCILSPESDEVFTSLYPNLSASWSLNSANDNVPNKSITSAVLAISYDFIHMTLCKT